MSLSRRHMLTVGATGLAAAIAAPKTQAQTQKSVAPATTVNPQGAFAGKSQANQSMNTTSQGMTDPAAIINAVNGIAIFADLRDWSRCCQSFSDRVEFDYTSLTGGTPTVMAADQQMQQWSDFFKSTFKSTQHIVGSHVVTIQGDTATCVSNFQAHHTYLDSKKGVWILSGVYNHDLVRVGDGWKVNKMKMTWTWENGTRPF